MLWFSHDNGVYDDMTISMGAEELCIIGRGRSLIVYWVSACRRRAALDRMVPQLYSSFLITSRDLGRILWYTWTSRWSLTLLLIGTEGGRSEVESGCLVSGAWVVETLCCREDIFLSFGWTRGCLFCDSYLCVKTGEPWQSSRIRLHHKSFSFSCCYIFCLSLIIYGLLHC